MTRPSLRAPASVAGVALVAALGVYGAAASPLFSVSRVTVSGAGAEVGDRLVARLRWGQGRNVLDVQQREIDRAVAMEPRIASARLVRHLPSVLEVRVIPRGPVAYVATGQSIVEVDKQGRVLGPPPAGTSRELPVITGAWQPGAVPEPLEPAPQAVALGAELADRLLPLLGGRLSELHLDAERGEWRLLLTDGSSVEWGVAGDGQGSALSPDDLRRLTLLSALLQRLGPGDMPFQADMRNGDRVTWSRATSHGPAPAKDASGL
ncbi:cell division protein FtsQ/DivIB [Carboxydochorda subterranea]|uniref:Cell division protein FtsQ/DivIB n=1 Tax=Carboxydichorda subterranea TaxID=3109565 RepID=A0ABZ1C3G2_9FIRM|nr:cell division protein FtsQ/DivIB [Limnochorda sp. L945t]WRP18613.1 cell division protein FtsQ/DivIB [Limnochorda sp. L945t]